jgi:hypothetical protein
MEQVFGLLEVRSYEQRIAHEFDSDHGTASDVSTLCMNQPIGRSG